MEGDTIVFDGNVVKSTIVNAQTNELSFSTKKNPAPSGEEEGWMMPAFRAAPMYFSMGCYSGVMS